MALDQNGSSFGSWTDAEIAERVRFGQGKWEKLIQDLIAAKNLIATFNNPWSRNDDVWDHFTRDETTRAGYQLNRANSGTPSYALDIPGHFLTLIAQAGETSIFTVASRRIDRIATVFETRAQVIAHDPDVSPFAGFTISETANHRASPPSDGVWFERGSNANTWKCRSRSGGADQTTTDNQAGNYVTWDVLRIELAIGSAKFFINDTLVATHSVNIPTAVLLHGFVQVERSGAPTTEFDIDFFSWSASENAVSP